MASAPTTQALPPRVQHRVFEHVRNGNVESRCADEELPIGSQVDTITERGIHVGPWTITVAHGSIANASDNDALSRLLDIPMPEMPFPHNVLVLHHHPSGFEYNFDATRALQCVDGVPAAHRLDPIDCAFELARAQGIDNGVARRKRALSGSGIKVSYANEWGKSRCLEQLLDPSQDTRSQAPGFDGPHSGSISSAKQFDWTYSTTWPGAPGCNAPPSLDRGGERIVHDPFQLGLDPARDRIPVERLGANSGQPILFYDDIMLFEDELGDNGSSMLNVKVRVMPNAFLVLQRFFLRVDNVVFRVFDTRIYCSFVPTDGEPVPAAERAEAGPSHWPRVIRECRGSEASYEDVKRYLVPHRPDDLSQLTNVSWVAETMDKIQAQRFRNEAAKAASGTGFAPSLAPAQAPSSALGNAPQNAILGEIEDSVPGWEGDGACVHVAVLRH
ncbi:Tap42 interacting protein [Malassezia vespertilionis]|uniref:Tip41p n=1 Tax=Malassezia vespertilionis TaxID=2020962 RepID=A0A2N1JDR6_9BASI|nr:Tap42 interacting protein [Malassezia vespertilionis]PKI84676.1 hypothetical protein MVES_001316 [Malassezia vespertilionis]WFD06057.1 Tap42 interacting protein [Malassezia vespertilionis]